MRPKPPLRRYHHGAPALLVVVALTATACAGGVGTGGDATPRPGVPAAPSAAPALAPGADESAAAVPGAVPAPAGRLTAS